MSSTALITITAGEANGREIESEFKLKAGPNSSWRWYAKKLGEGKYQMRFPNAQTIDDIAHFMELRMRSKPDVVCKVEKGTHQLALKVPWMWLGSGLAISHMRKGHTQMYVWWHPRWVCLLK